MKKFFVVSLSILNFTAASAQLLPARPSVVIVSTKPQLNDEDLKIINAHLCDPAEDEDGNSKYKIDPIPGFPPFDNVDDPATPNYPCDPITGKRDPLHGDIEANFVGQGTRSAEGVNWFQVPYFDLNYGTGFWIFKHLQLKAEGGYSWKTGETISTQQGMGNILLGVKWMFYEGGSAKEDGALRNVNMGFYPQVQLVPVSESVKNGVAEGGKIYIFPFLVTKKIEIADRPIGLTFNLAYQHGTGGEPNSVYGSAASGVAIAPRTAAMVSFSQQTNFNSPHPFMRKYEFGLVHEIKDDTKAFFMVGQQQSGASYFIWNLGVQKIFHTRRH